MKATLAIFKGGSAILGGILGYLFGTMDGALITLFIMIILDYITGVMCAVYKHTLSSEVGYKGIIKKIFIVLLIVVANLVDVYVLHMGSALRNGVVFFFIANEAISILENGAILGVPIPQKLKDVLAQLKKENDKQEPPKENKNNKLE